MCMENLKKEYMIELESLYEEKILVLNQRNFLQIKGVGGGYVEGSCIYIRIYLIRIGMWRLRKRVENLLKFFEFLGSLEENFIFYFCD